MAGRKLGRNSAQRKALFRNLMTELFRHGKIETTYAKAMSVRSQAEKLVTVAKRGKALRDAQSSDQAERRLVAAVLTDDAVTKHLFDEIAGRYMDRPGGYTRVSRLGPRLGDAAEMVILELV
ncbi:MAG: 50S ribosomal protein L17 [Chloroflexi bacterium]|nr:50S ribosomal protein L17 [Chloroflexota bacterium]